MARNYLGSIGLGLIALLSGCISVPPQAPPINKGRPVSVPPVTVQYRNVIENGFGCNTAEIYWHNTNAVPITFNSIALDQEFLPLTSDKIYWWQFYPSPVVKPGDTVLCQINFRERSRKNQEITLFDSNGPVDHVSLPSFSRDNMDKRFTAVTYSIDYKRMFVQFEAGRWLPMRVWVNRREIEDFKVMKPIKNDTPGMVGFDTPFKIETGTPLYICIRFNDGTWKHAYVRALNGVFLDSFNMTNNILRKDFSLDQTIPVVDPKSESAGDVCCYDAINGKNGKAAPQLVEERKWRWIDGTISNRLTSLHYCTAEFSPQWDLYGQLMDMALASPYSYGFRGGAYIEKEERYIGLTSKAAAPRPFGWIAEAYKSRDRYLTPDEIEMLAWLALVRGAKGIRYFTCDFDSGFIHDPTLMKSLPKITKSIAAHRKILSPLAFQGDQSLWNGGVKVSQSWAGDEGLLVFVRNLNYSVQTNNPMASSFVVNIKTNIRIPIKLPEWLNAKRAVDLKTGKPLRINHHRGRDMTIGLADLKTYRLIWIPNEDKRRNRFKLFSRED